VTASIALPSIAAQSIHLSIDRLNYNRFVGDAIAIRMAVAEELPSMAKTVMVATSAVLTPVMAESVVLSDGNESCTLVTVVKC